MSLLTDLYQLTMAYGYWKSGMAEKESVFHLFFRKNPFEGGYTITCGLEYVIDFLKEFKFSEDDLDYLATLKTSAGTVLFEADFLEYLKEMKFSCDIDAIPEGTVVFPHEPLIRVKGPILQAQLIETALLNIMNFQSLIATKASRVSMAAQGEPVIEFGLRRAQGIDGGLAASRAAYIGGCASTSNVLAGKLFDIPVSGTHAHSWVMSFESERASFEAYAAALPDNCIFLVDTFDTIKGIEKAITVGKLLKESGKKMLGIRIDSGDLAYFSIKAREMLDAAGFTDAVIVASNDLDEHIMNSLKNQDAKVNVWGVGTKLVTAYDQPALGSVYKLSAMENDANAWDYKIKLSEQSIKINNPGIQQVRRYYFNNQFMTDMIFDVDHIPGKKIKIIDPMDVTKRKVIDEDSLISVDLLVPVFRGGKCIYPEQNIHEVKQKVQNELLQLHKGVKRFVNPHKYVVGLEEQLHNIKTSLILKLRNID